jgi:hypothetical protein
VTKDGKITGMDLKHCSTAAPARRGGTFYTRRTADRHVRRSRYRFRGCRVFTNKPPCGEAAMAHPSAIRREVQLDKIENVSISTRPNCVLAWLRSQHDRQLPARRHHRLAECIRRVIDRSDWRQKFRKLPLGRVGLACSSSLRRRPADLWNELPHRCATQARSGGGVTVFCGATEIGQGSDDVLVAIVSEILGIDPFDVRPVTGDTDLTPVDLGSYSSRVTLMMGNAAIQAAERAREILATAVSAKLEIPANRLVFADRRVFDCESPGHGVTFQEAVCIAEARTGTIGTTGSYTPPASAALFRVAV